MDCVTSLSGCVLELDAWGVDAVYSGTQKCLAVPPGLSPISFNERALAKVPISLRIYLLSSISTLDRLPPHSRHNCATSYLPHVTIGLPSQQVRARKTPVQSWYLDVNLLAKYYSDGAPLLPHVPSPLLLTVVPSLSHHQEIRSFLSFLPLFTLSHAC